MLGPTSDYMLLSHNDSVRFGISSMQCSSFLSTPAHALLIDGTGPESARFSVLEQVDHHSVLSSRVQVNHSGT
jgi:hypothetical protein